MKRILFVVASCFAFAMIAPAQPTRPVKQVLELKMPKTEDDDMPGTRGASVAWNPVLKKYYAAFAGNVAYPLGVFDEKGKLLSDEDQTTMVDVRSLWYNPANKTIMGNGYGDLGWFKYTTDAKGIPTEYEVVIEGQTQPNDQSVGAFNPLTKETLFYYNGMVYRYSDKGVLKDSVLINFGKTAAKGAASPDELEEVIENYNYTSLISTGVKGQEVGLLNTLSREIELYDLKTGFMTKKISLPITATVEASFNFSYANNTFWLFDMETRTWTGYR